MKPAFFFLALVGCTMERPQPILTSLQGYIIDVCYERDGSAQSDCIKEARLNQALCGAPTCVEMQRRLMCTGPTEVIADDDPALAFFRTDEGLSLATRKEALAIERVNSCD